MREDAEDRDECRRIRVADPLTWGLHSLKEREIRYIFIPCATYDLTIEL